MANARNKLVGQLLADANFLTNDWKGAITGLALLAGVQPGDPDYATVQARLQTYARARASAGPQPVGLPIWDWAYTGLFLAEYYLATGDANVLPGIHSYTLKLARSQSINGTFGHTYLGASGYYGMNSTACYILTYALPMQRLYITGKSDTPADPPPLALDAATVAHAVTAANFKVDSPGFTAAQLITSLSDYNPVVRHYAAIELGKRTLNSTDPTTLRNMVTGHDANGRMGACQALGLLRDSTLCAGHA